MSVELGCQVCVVGNGYGAPPSSQPPASPHCCCHCCHRSPAGWLSRTQLTAAGGRTAGLNAINSASKYLNPGDRIVCVARTAEWGGHWSTQYNFCTLVTQPTQAPTLLVISGCFRSGACDFSDFSDSLLVNTAPGVSGIQRRGKGMGPRQRSVFVAFMGVFHKTKCRLCPWFCIFIQSS